MEYDFDQVIDRRGSWARKWSPEVVKGVFGFSDNLLPMWIADMDFRCPPAVVEAMEQVVRQGIYGYTYVPPELYQAIIRWCKTRHDWTVAPEWITFTHGTVSTLHYIVQAFCRKGDRVIMQTPGYDPFHNAVVRQGCEPCYNPLRLINGRYELDFADLEEQARHPGTKLLLFCSPHNPSGRVWSPAELAEVAAICARNNVLVVSDEIHKDLVLYGNRHTPFSTLSSPAAANCIMCFSPNKAFNFGGLKSSYTIIPNESIRKVFQNQLTKNSITSPNVFAVPAIIAAYTQSDEWLSRLIQYIEANFSMVRSFLQENLPAVKLIEPEASYLAWLDFRQVEPDWQKLDKLLVEGAKVGLGGGHTFIANGDGFARMNLGCPASVVKEAMGRIGQAVKSRKRSAY